MNKDLKVGQEVWLSPNNKWGRSDTNPINTRGVITDIDYYDGYDNWVSVLWDNGTTNSYNKMDSDLMTSPETCSIREVLLDIICEDGVLGREGFFAQNIVDRIIASGLLKGI